MTLKAYLDNIEAKTGMTPEDFRQLAKKQGLLRDGVKTGEIVKWLKGEFGLGHGHAMAIVHMLRSAEEPKISKSEAVARHFEGGKSAWRESYDRMMSQVADFGSDVRVSPTKSYISLLRKDSKFGIVQITAKRMDIGIKLKGTPSNSRFENAGSWNNMVTHRVRLDQPGVIDSEVMEWLRRAYEKA